MKTLILTNVNGNNIRKTILINSIRFYLIESLY